MVMAGWDTSRKRGAMKTAAVTSTRHGAGWYRSLHSGPDYIGSVIGAYRCHKAACPRGFFQRTGGGRRWERSLALFGACAARGARSDQKGSWRLRLAVMGGSRGWRGGLVEERLHYDSDCIALGMESRASLANLGQTWWVEACAPSLSRRLRTLGTGGCACGWLQPAW